MCLHLKDMRIDFEKEKINNNFGIIDIKPKTLSWAFVRIIGGGRGMLTTALNKKEMTNLITNETNSLGLRLKNKEKIASPCKISLLFNAIHVHWQWLTTPRLEMKELIEYVTEIELSDLIHNFVKKIIDCTKVMIV